MYHMNRFQEKFLLQLCPRFGRNDAFFTDLVPLLRAEHILQLIKLQYLNKGIFHGMINHSFYV